MQMLHALLDLRPSSLIGRDPASLVMEVLDDTMQDNLHVEMDALFALANSHASLLPHGRARNLTVEMAPMLCSLTRDETEIPELLSFIHQWVVGLGDLTRTIRAYHASREEARLVFAEYGHLDAQGLLAIPEVDQHAIQRYQRLEMETSTSRGMHSWSIMLFIADQRTLAVGVRVGERKAIIGAAHIDDDHGPQKTSRTPELVV